MDTASSIEPDQAKHAAQAYPEKHSCGFSVSGIINLYLYPPVTECVGPGQSARNTQADLDRYIM